MAANAPIQMPTAGGILVASLPQAKKHKRKFDAVLTIEDPKTAPHDRLRLNAVGDPSHLVLKFEDVDTDDLGYATATKDQILSAIEFGRSNTDGSLMIHCRHGVGRSAACALAIIADRAGPGNEAAAVDELISIRPSATPNLVAVAHADAILGLDGALIAALDAYEVLHPAKTDARAIRKKFAEENPWLYTKKPKS